MADSGLDTGAGATGGAGTEPVAGPAAVAEASTVIPQETAVPEPPAPAECPNTREPDAAGSRPKAAKIDTTDDAATAAHGSTTPTATATTATATSTTDPADRNAAAAASWPKPYYLEAGLRRVEAYYYTYNTWVKERWRGRTLISVFESEFRDRPLAYYRAAMEAGTVSVNGQTVGPDHVLKNGERVSHTLHRHEPPVTADPVTVIHEDADMLVINKPAGVPVHPAGRYMYNSVVEILKHERGAGFVPYPCNRLDRLTSGIMFLAKSPATAKRLSLQIQARAVRKEYLARVVGRFPDGEVLCDQPILVISPKLGLNRVRANGRSARTVFKRLAYYGPDDDGHAAEAGPGGSTRGYSVVRCLPVTGRTHQLRVHLQYLGHPIENDPIYANQRVWGFDLGQGDADASRHSDEDIISRLSRMGKEDVAEAVAYYDDMVDEYHKRKAERMSGRRCAACDTPLYTDPGAHELSLWLHSLRYEAADGAWSYASPLPAWALPPDGASGPTEVGALDDLLGAAGRLDVEDAPASQEGRHPVAASASESAAASAFPAPASDPAPTQASAAAPPAEPQQDSL